MSRHVDCGRQGRECASDPMDLRLSCSHRHKISLHNEQLFVLHVVNVYLSLAPERNEAPLSAHVDVLPPRCGSRQVGSLERGPQMSWLEPKRSTPQRGETMPHGTAFGGPTPLYLGSNGALVGRLTGRSPLARATRQAMTPVRQRARGPQQSRREFVSGVAKTGTAHSGLAMDGGLQLVASIFAALAKSFVQSCREWSASREGPSPTIRHGRMDGCHRPQLKKTSIPTRRFGLIRRDIAAPTVLCRG